jgi:hypothetical protein
MSEAAITTYSQRSKPYAQEAEFSLMPQHLAIEQGRRSGNFLFSEIVMIRLMYRPRNTTNEGYQAKIYRRDKRTALLSNLSWKSLVDVERQDADYSQFVRALIARAIAGNPGIILVAGMPRWLHLLTAAMGFMAVVAMVAITGKALQHNTWPVALFTASIGIYLGWWALRYVTRNRPQRFTADAIPPVVMPPEVRKPAAGSGQ